MKIDFVSYQENISQDPQINSVVCLRGWRSIAWLKYRLKYEEYVFQGENMVSQMVSSEHLGEAQLGHQLLVFLGWD